MTSENYSAENGLSAITTIITHTPDSRVEKCTAQDTQNFYINTDISMTMWSEAEMNLK